MKTKNLTPFLFGTKVTCRQPPQLEMTMVIVGRFALRPGEPVVPIEGVLERGTLTADVFGEDDDDRKGATKYASDFADFKLNAEVLLSGSCHAPRKRPVTEAQVTFSVGAWSKSLRVVGRRVWTENLVGKVVSEAVPFTSMPIVYANAFGGPEYPKNPVGRGLGTPELPTIEHVDEPIRSKTDRPEPAGFGPINPGWAQRRDRLGRQYGAAFRERGGFYAEDCDWKYFHAAPGDQQLEGYLRGDEEMTFENLHSASASFSARLPGLRVRAFVRNREQPMVEARVNLDTLHADMEGGLLTLTWRGLVPVGEDDLEDVQTVLVASEPLADPPLPEGHYRAILEAFEADPLEKDRFFPPEARAAGAAAFGEDGHPKDPVDMAEALARDYIAAAPAEERPALEKGLAAFSARAREASARVAEGAKDAGSANARARDAERMKRVLSQVDDLRKKLPPGAASKELDELDALIKDPKLALYLNPPKWEPRAGADLKGADLSNQDLSGMDLSGADLGGARLFGTKLVGAKLTGANLFRALLFEADLSGADLSGAVLKQALLNNVRAVEANLSGAIIDASLFDGADLSGADLTDVRGEMVLLGRAVLRGVNARRMSLFKAMSLKGNLEDADLSATKLTQCMFMEARGRGLVLTGARLDKTSFAKSDLRGASLEDVSGPGSIWIDAVLDGVDFSYASLPDSHFMNASAKGTRFMCAVLRRASFYRAVLDGAELVDADLFQANLSKSSLTDAKLTRSNLYQMSLRGAKGDRCDFTGADLEHVIRDER
jgi:uncharacterized protein YjbI with pentapeptide repeats